MSAMSSVFATQVTHFTVTWANIVASGGGSHQNADQTIPFISIPCTLQFNISPVPANANRFYKNGNPTGSTIGNGGTVSVSTGDTLHWSVNSPTPLSGTITITNVTDGGSVVSTFTYNIS